MRLLGKRADAKTYFSKSKDQALQRYNYITYYQGLSYMKLGEKQKAAELF